MVNKTLPLSLVLKSGLLSASASSNEEEVPANEEAATQQIVQMIKASVWDEAKNGLARRDAHAKAHGCVQAEFRVLDNLPEKVRVGIFGETPASTRRGSDTPTVPEKCKTTQSATLAGWRSSSWESSAATLARKTFS
jgi:hypothetical protein